MAIRQKGNKFQVDVTVRGVRAPRRSADTVMEAQQIEAQFKAHLLAGGDPAELTSDGATVASSKPTLGQALDAAYSDKWKGAKAEASSLRCGTEWCKLLGYDFPLADLDLIVLTKVCDTLTARGNRGSTVNRKLAALKVMVGSAIKRDWLIAPPHYPKYREYGGRLRYYSDEEVKSLLEWVSGSEKLHDLFILAVETGMRYGNLLGLIKRDVDLYRGTIALEINKGDTPRSLRITNKAMPVLKKLMDATPRDSDKLFPAETKEVKSKHISNVIAAWRADRDLPADDEACFHTFRHTCCSRLVQAGVPIMVVKEWMCHETLETTLRYSHLAPNSHELALNALNQWDERKEHT